MSQQFWEQAGLHPACSVSSNAFCCALQFITELLMPFQIHSMCCIPGSVIRPVVLHARKRTLPCMLRVVLLNFTMHCSQV